MTYHVVPVIFARGTGDEVPLSSARLLAGKPILHHVIGSAFGSAYISDVYVSTEDERIATVAEAAKAKVIMRPDNLAQPTTPLARAVEHAVQFLKQNNPGNYPLLCLPADAVFCETSLIDHAVEKYFEGTWDRLIALLPEKKKYVVWKLTDETRLDPVILQPHLRTEKHLLFSEPGVLTIWKVFEDGTIDELTENVGYVDIDPTSAFRVDTEEELSAANRIFQAPKLALRCDGSREMGMGHVMRLLNIADHMQKQAISKWDIRFFIGSDHLEGARVVTERGFDVDIVDQIDIPNWVRRIQSFNPSLVVNDLPTLPAKYTEELAGLTAHSLTIVDSVRDIEPSKGRLDTVISLLDEDLDGSYGQFHHGPAFAAVDPSVRLRLAANLRGQIRSNHLRILVSFGTGDPVGLTQPALTALADSVPDWESVTVIIQEGQRGQDFHDAVGRFKCPVEVINSPSDRLGELLNMSDIALLSGGISTYEASALGVPAIVLCQNERELIRMEQFERIGSIILLGLGLEVTQSQLIRTLKRIADDTNLRSKMSVAGQQMIDGYGIDRIIHIIDDLYRDQATVSLRSSIQ